MFIESKVSKIVEGKKTTTRDIIALEEATTESSVKLYTSEATRNLMSCDEEMVHLLQFTVCSFE